MIKNKYHRGSIKVYKPKEKLSFHCCIFHHVFYPHQFHFLYEMDIFRIFFPTEPQTQTQFQYSEIELLVQDNSIKQIIGNFLYTLLTRG